MILRNTENQNHKLLHYIFNYSPETKTINYPYKASTSLLDNQKLNKDSEITIEPWGVVIGEEKL